MKRMTTVKKRMRGIILNGPAQVGDKIKAGERVIGDVLHVHETIGRENMGHKTMGIAMIRLDRLAAADVSPSLNEAPVTIMDSVAGNDD
jgi:hypothetical protein